MSFPHHTPAFAGSETAAAAHIQRYFSIPQGSSYKTTRNGLSGTDYSSKFLPWLATGALLARTAYTVFKQLEQTHGAYIYLGRGLRNDAPPPTHNPCGFLHWFAGTKGEPLVNAGMCELRTTGYISNRLRQVVASYLIYDLNADWRAGAAWFESQLLDYYVFSNQGS